MNDSHLPVWTLWASLAGRYVWRSGSTQGMSTTRSISCAGSCWAASNPPKSLEWESVGREASPPWLHATQLLPSRFVSSSVLHFNYTVPHLTDANRGTTCSSNSGFAWCPYVYSCTAVKKAQIDARQGKSWKLFRIMQQRHVRDLALVLWLPHFWVKRGDHSGEEYKSPLVGGEKWGRKIKRIFPDFCGLCDTVLGDNRSWDASC